MINVSKTGNTESLSKTQFMVHRTEWIKIYGIISLDFKYKVDPFNLYIIDNYVKRTIGKCIP